jgi:hypothetical protein
MANKISVIIDVAVDKASASLKNFRQDIAKAEGASGKLKAGWSAASTAIAANAGALAASAGAALVSFGVKSVQAFQDTALAARDFSNATQVSVEEASRLIEVAGDFGIEASAVEGAVMKMNKAIADGKPVFADYGITVAETETGLVDANETFINAITTIGKIQDPTKRAQAAQQAFGKSYGEVSRFMAMSAEELRSALAGVSDEQAISDEEAQRAEDFALAMDNLQDKLKGVTMEVGGELVPVLTALATSFDIIERGAKRVGEALPGGESFIGKLFGEAEKLVNPFARLVDAAEDAGDALGLNGDAYDDTAARAEYYRARVVGVTSDLARQTIASNDSTEADKDAAEARREVAAATAQAQKAAEERLEAERELYGFMLSQLGTERAYEAQVDSTEDAISDLNETLTDGKSTLEDIDDATRNAADAALSQAEAFAKSKGAADNSKESVRLQIEELYRLVSTLDPKSPLRQYLLGYIGELQKIPARIDTMLALNIRSGAVTTRDGDFIGQRVVPGESNIVGANGGIVTRPTLATIGEAGPEAVIPLERAPGASPLPASLGAGAGNITVNIYPKALPTDRELIDLVNSVRRRNGNVI